jgi:3-deoxy-manno-octulosonate cytidylyltransferase (CMP-KDO synthetase)
MQSDNNCNDRAAAGTFWVVIPARFDSKRLPGKILMDLQGQTVLERVCRQAAQSHAERIIVATDEPRVVTAAERLGVECILTSGKPTNGSERIAEVVRRTDPDDQQVIVNLQGDEPFVPPALIDQIALDLLAHEQADVASLYEPINSVEDLFDPNLIKVVLDDQGYALYFSRAPIPWDRDHFMQDKTSIPGSVPFMKRVGMYAYRAGFLKAYADWPQDQRLEAVEVLEQQRMLVHGARVHLSEARFRSPCNGINTQEDLEQARRYLQGQVAG